MGGGVRLSKRGKRAAALFLLESARFVGSDPNKYCTCNLVALEIASILSVVTAEWVLCHVRKTLPPNEDDSA